jgi:hypothetical protein
MINYSFDTGRIKDPIFAPLYQIIDRVGVVIS